MSLYELLPTKKVTAFLLGAAVVVAGFWLLMEFEVVDDWPEALVMVAWVIIVGFIFAWIVPEGVWGKVQGHLEGTVDLDLDSSTSAGTEVSGDVTLTPTGEGTAEISGDVHVDNGDDTGEVFEE